MSRAKKNNRLLGSGILLAFTSSLCCIVPLLALLGTAGSAASMLSWVAPMRPFLLAATAIVLGIAFYRAYRPATKDACGCAEDTPKGLMQSKGFLWVIAIVSVGLSAFPYYAPYFQQKAAPVTVMADAQGLSRVVMDIEGMSCAACEGHVNSALQGQKGVQEVVTSYAGGNAMVRYDSTQVSLQQLTTALEAETGYKVTGVKTDQTFNQKK